MTTFNETTSIGTGVPYDIVLSIDSGIPTKFNANQKDIDFEISGTGLNKSLFFDASTGRLGIGTGLPDAVLHIIAPCAKDGAIIESITNCPTGVTLLLLHNPQTLPQTGSYPATINLAGRDNNYNEIIYGQIQSRILDPRTSQTSGEIIFSVDHTGINKEVFVASVDRVVLGTMNDLNGSSYLVLGYDNSASGQNYLLIGDNNSSSNLLDSVVVGSSNTHSGPELLSVSYGSLVSGSGSLFIGKDSDSIGSKNLCVVRDSEILGSDNTVIGSLLNLSGTKLISILNSGTIIGSTGIFLGDNIYVSGNRIIQLGSNIQHTGNDSSLIGSDIISSGNTNIIYGNSLNISGNDIIGIGNNHNISNISNAVLLSKNVNLTDSSNVVLLGFSNQTQSGLNNSIVVGGTNNLANTSANNVIVLGYQNISDVINNSILLGNSNNASGNNRNVMILGSGNVSVADSFNNIILGTLNNRSGVYLNSQAEVSGVGGTVAANSFNSIAIGQNNLSFLSSSNAIIGNKNVVSGTNISSFGSFNNLRNTSGVYTLGNSNYIEGQNIVAIGRKITVQGSNSIAINNTSSDMEVYGSGSIMVGNNSVVCSGITVGHNNTINTVSGLVYGTNNYVGLSKHLFTTTLESSSVININALVGNFYNTNDIVLVQLKSPAGTQNNLYATITNVSENPIQTTTSINIGGALSLLNLSERFVSINNTFDENNTPNTTISGYIIALKNHEQDKFYGVNSLVFGNNNNQKYSNGILIGHNNVSTGINSVVIGNNITNVGDNSIHIGSSNTNKIVFNDSYLVFNTGTTQQNVVYRGFNADTAAYFDLVNNRLGINNNNPRSSVDVSGTITTSSFRVGLFALSGDVLTSNASGFATWQTPVRLSGSDNGLLYRVNSIVASGIDGIRYTENTNGLNFYDNIYILENSGIIINADRGVNIIPRPLTIWGSGAAFAPKLLEVVPGINRTFMFDFFASTGLISGLSVINNVSFPTALTGTLLYVNNSGQVLNRVNQNNTVVFADNGSWSSGNSKFRWFDNQNILTLGNDPNRPGASVNTVLSDTEYNIMLSSTGTIHTVFNNNGLGNNFAIFRSGSAGTVDRRGFHVATNSGNVGINAQLSDILNTNNTLYVNGKTFTSSLQLGGSPQSGLYLRTGDNGNIVATVPTFDIGFSGIYPIETTTVGQQLQVGISKKKSSGGTNLSTAEEGKTLVWTGTDWIVGSGLQIWQDTQGNQLKGMMIGHGTSLGGSSDGSPILTNGTVFGGGSFNDSATARLGSSQFSIFHLRNRTIGNETKTLTTNWQTVTGQQTTRSSNNVIRFPSDKYGVWSFTAYVNVIWQLQSDSTSMGAGGYIVQGTVSNLVNSFTLVGTTGVTSFMSSAVPNTISVVPNTTTFNSLDISVSGSAGYNMLWSSTVNINQLMWPQDLTFSST